jgi:hypothetical protein
VVLDLSDFEMISGIASSAIRRLDNGELVFTLERALEVIEACTFAAIAVLGIELFPGLNVSTYDLHLKEPDGEAFWLGYVRTNNALAENFVRKNPPPDSIECILTTASWREFCKDKEESKRA